MYEYASIYVRLEIYVYKVTGKLNLSLVSVFFQTNFLTECRTVKIDLSTFFSVKTICEILRILTGVLDQKRNISNKKKNYQPKDPREYEK